MITIDTSTNVLVGAVKEAAFWSCS